jgi:hypothetical protein
VIGLQDGPQCMARQRDFISRQASDFFPRLHDHQPRLRHGTEPQSIKQEPTTLVAGDAEERESAHGNKLDRRTFRGLHLAPCARGARAEVGRLALLHRVCLETLGQVAGIDLVGACYQTWCEA